MPRTAGKMDKRVPEQSRPDTSLEAKRTKLTLCDSGASREQTGALGKIIPSGNIRAAGDEEFRPREGRAPSGKPRAGARGAEPGEDRPGGGRASQGRQGSEPSAQRGAPAMSQAARNAPAVHRPVRRHLAPRPFRGCTDRVPERRAVCSVDRVATRRGPSGGRPCCPCGCPGAAHRPAELGRRSPAHARPVRAEGCERPALGPCGRRAVAFSKLRGLRADVLSSARCSAVSCGVRSLPRWECGRPQRSLREMWHHRGPGLAFQHQGTGRGDPALWATVRVTVHLRI